MNLSPRKRTLLLWALLMLVLAGCSGEKPARYATTAPVAPPPSTPSTPAAPAPPATTPTVPPPLPPEPTVTAPPPAPVAAPPATPGTPPPQPKVPKPAAPAAPSAPGTAAPGKARMSKADSLFEKPFADARSLARLNAGTEVEVLGREGAWYQVRAAGQQGWLRMLSVRSTAPAAVASSGSLTDVATGRAGSGRIVSTTGVRGLGEERLKEAPFSEAAIAAAERFRVKPEEAGRLARAQGLAPRQVPPLPTAASGTEGGAP